jgi:parvulin-like peptidyl-prolyl isomerase
MRKVVHDRGYAKWIMGGLAVIFIIGFCLLGYSGRNSHNNSTESVRGGVIVKVNGEAIDRGTFESDYSDQLQQVVSQQMNGDTSDMKDSSRMEELVGPLQAERLRGQTLDQVVNQTILLQAAQKQGIRISSGDVRREVDKAVDDEVNQLRDKVLANSKGPKTDAALDKEIQKLKPGTSLGMIRNQIKDSIDQKKLTDRLTIQKLLEGLKKGIDTSDKAFRESFDAARLRQITIGTAKRSDSEALKIANDTVAKLRGGADFAATAKQVSDDPYKSHGGDWGFPVPKMYLSKELADATFKLKVGEISAPVRTDQGYVIVRLESKESKLPKDYNDPKKQAEYKQRYVSEMEQQLENTFFQSMRKSAKIDIVDPEMKAYSMLKAADITKPKTILDAVKVYESGISAAQGDSMTLARIYSEVAAVYQALRQSKGTSKDDSKKYRDAEQQALQQALQYTEQNDLRLMLADILIEQKSYEKALENLSYVGDNAANDPAAHQAALQRYETMKKAGYGKVSAKIAEEQKWIAENAKVEKAAQSRTGNQMPNKQ